MPVNIILSCSPASTDRDRSCCRPGPGCHSTAARPPRTRIELIIRETGHYVSALFHNYWAKYGGLSQFGLPLTEEFQEKNPADGKTYNVQYFERNRFEYHPEFKGTFYEIELGLLGRQVTGNRVFPMYQPRQGRRENFTLTKRTIF